MPTETVRYLDEPVELEIAGRRVQYAPMRMEWSFDPERHPIETRELVFASLPDTGTIRVRAAPSFVPYRVTGEHDLRNLAVMLAWDSGAGL